jgi:hypothetical protein
MPSWCGFLRERHNLGKVVGHGVVGGGLIAPFLATPRTAMHDNPALFARMRYRHWYQQAMAGFGAVARENIDVQAVQTVRAVVANAAIGEWWHVLATVGADKAGVGALGGKATHDEGTAL